MTRVSVAQNQDTVPIHVEHAVSSLDSITTALRGHEHDVDVSALGALAFVSAFDPDTTAEQMVRGLIARVTSEIPGLAVRDVRVRAEVTRG